MDRVDRVSDDVSAVGSTRVLNGAKVISAHSLATALECTDSLVSFLVGGTRSQPEDWFDEVLAHLKRLSESGHNVVWTVYLLYDFSGETPNFRGRLAKLSAEGLRHQVHLKYAHYRAPAAYEFFVVDGRHSYVALPTVPEVGRSTARALYIRNDPQVASHLTTWADSLDAFSHDE
jgi:hypothetical protein